MFGVARVAQEASHFLVVAREPMLLATARRALGSLMPALAGASRGMKGKVLAKGMWDGWPRFSPDGWPYARAMKKSRGDKYMTKQAWRRMMGLDKGVHPA